MTTSHVRVTATQERLARKLAALNPRTPPPTLAHLALGDEDSIVRNLALANPNTPAHVRFLHALT